MTERRSTWREAVAVLAAMLLVAGIGGTLDHADTPPAQEARP